MPAIDIDSDTTHYTVYHRSDFSGEVVIDWSAPSVPVHLCDGMPVASDANVRLPFAVLKTIVAAWVRSVKTEQLGEADSDEILLGLLG